MDAILNTHNNTLKYVTAKKTASTGRARRTPFMLAV